MTLAPERSASLVSVAAMLAAVGSSAVVQAIVHHLSATLPIFEIVFFRNFVGLICIAPWLLGPGLSGLLAANFRFHVLRGLLGVAGLSTWFYGLALIPLAEATALNFTSTIFACLFAVWFLGETMTGQRWLAVSIGFAGMLVMLRPGLAVISFGALVVLGSSVLWAASLAVLKHLADTDSSATIVGMLYVFLSILSLPLALLVWQWPNSRELPWLIAMGVIAVLSHLSMAKAFKLADASKLMPLDFTRLIWAAALGWLVFAEIIDAWTLAGGALIFAGGMLTSAAEKKKGTAVT